MALTDIVEEYGYEDAVDACEGEGWHIDSVVPGSCKTCDYVTETVEPDARDYSCPECETNTVNSVLVLMGIL